MRNFWFRTVATAAIAAAASTSAHASDPNATTPEGASDGVLTPYYGEINPFYGDISPFYGDISPFWGDISPFWGDISPFYGDIGAFWGDIDPFHGDIDAFWGDIAPFWGDIAPFWGDIEAFWGDIDPFADEAAGQYVEASAMLDEFYARSESAWADAVEERTGRDFWSGFAEKVYARYGIDPDDPSSLSRLDHDARARFFMDWYDGLMEFSGVDHVDHWMAAVNWRPVLTQDLDMGAGAPVGILDTPFEGAHVYFSGGYDVEPNGHGAAVASLIAAPHDGRGVMGIAPDARIAQYNPFDETGTSNWRDVSAGIVALARQGSHVINMSLGQPGYVLSPEWYEILSDPNVQREAGEIVFVKAAGNDGVAQSQNVRWGWGAPSDHLIIVGSTDPSGHISSFSNTPGTACLETWGYCAEENKLKYRFIVAPGENILVEDGEGGVRRVSGTSFAAPLVSGTVALIHARWPWFRDHASETTQVIFESARDLGEPGVDPVYGWGMLDVEAALSPLDFDTLQIYTVDPNRPYYPGSTWTSTQSLKQTLLTPGRLRLAQERGLFLYAFEYLDSTYRDFAIPLSDAQAGSRLSNGWAEARAQTYIYERMLDWASGRSFNDTGAISAVASDDGALRMSLTAGRLDPTDQVLSGELPFHIGAVIENRNAGTELRFGAGEGALALSEQEGFGLFSDHRPETGGVNPVLGFASGGAYAATKLRVGEKTSVSFGLTSTEESSAFVDPFSGEEHVLHEGLSVYEAVAFLTGVRHEVSDEVVFTIDLTHLEEGTGLLGAQGAGALSLDGGAATDAVTIGAEAKFSPRLTVSVSSTAAITGSAQFENSALSVPDDVVSTAFQVSARRVGVFGEADAFRASLIQPLHIEEGDLAYTSLRVVDRETGEIGEVTEQWALGGERPLLAEALYATKLFEGRVDLNLFGRVSLSGDVSEQEATDLVSGARLRFAF